MESDQPVITPENLISIGFERRQGQNTYCRKGVNITFDRNGAFHVAPPGNTVVFALLKEILHGILAAKEEITG